MKFGVREICNVVLKAKAAQKVGNKIFYKNEPVLYFDTLKTSTELFDGSSELTSPVLSHIDKSMLSLVRFPSLSLTAATD